jgi:hypothetical protein
MCESCIPTNIKNWIRVGGCGCGFRLFLTPEEGIEQLEDYMEQLEKEIAGVKRRIEELKHE